MSDIEQARQIAKKLTSLRFPNASWLAGWTSACLAGQYDGDDDVRGPLIALRMARGATFEEAINA